MWRDLHVTTVEAAHDEPELRAALAAHPRLRRRARLVAGYRARGSTYRLTTAHMVSSRSGTSVRPSSSVVSA